MVATLALGHTPAGDDALSEEIAADPGDDWLRLGDVSSGVRPDTYRACRGATTRRLIRGLVPQ